jgi:hypothetical protein
MNVFPEYNPPNPQLGKKNKCVYRDSVKYEFNYDTVNIIKFFNNLPLPSLEQLSQEDNPELRRSAIQRANYKIEISMIVGQILNVTSFFRNRPYLITLIYNNKELLRPVKNSNRRHWRKIKVNIPDVVSQITWNIPEQYLEHPRDGHNEVGYPSDIYLEMLLVHREPLVKVLKYLKTVIDGLNGYYMKLLFPKEKTVPSLDKLKYRPPLYRYFEFVDKEMSKCLPENTESEAIEEQLTNIKYRSECVWIKNDIILPVSYKNIIHKPARAVFGGLAAPAPDEFGAPAAPAPDGFGEAEDRLGRLLHARGIDLPAAPAPGGIGLNVQEMNALFNNIGQDGGSLEGRGVEAFDVVKLMAGTSVRYISYWKENKTLLVSFKTNVDGSLHQPNCNWHDNSPYYGEKRTPHPIYSTNHIDYINKEFPYRSGNTFTTYCFVPLEHCGIYFKEGRRNHKLYSLDDPKLTDAAFIMKHSFGEYKITGPSKSRLQEAILNSGLKPVYSSFPISYSFSRNPVMADRVIPGIIPIGSGRGRKPKVAGKVGASNDYQNYLSMALEAHFKKTHSAEVIQKLQKQVKRLHASNPGPKEEWQEICSQIHATLKIDRLREIAIRSLKLTRDDVEGKSKMELCKLLAERASDKEEGVLRRIKPLQKKLKRAYMEKVEKYPYMQKFGKIAGVCHNFDEASQLHPDHSKFREMSGHEFFVLVKPDMTYHCYHVNNVQWALNNRLCKWTPVNPGDFIGDLGQRGSPDRSIEYFPFPLDNGFRGYLPKKDFYTIKQMVIDKPGDPKKVNYFYLGEGELTRMGDCRAPDWHPDDNEPGSLHGQAPGEQVYSIAFARQRIIPVDLPKPKPKDEVRPRKGIKEVETSMAKVKSELTAIHVKLQELKPTLDLIHEKTSGYQSQGHQMDLPDGLLTDEEESILMESQELQTRANKLAREEVQIKLKRSQLLR